MPESYFHIRCAKASYQKSGAKGYHIPALMLGAAGPDTLYYHMGLPPLLFLGKRMHTQRCGPFLTALVRGAESELLRSYALGFLSHYAADATLHNWIKAQPQAHAEVESALDSHYLHEDKGRAIARPDDSAPRLTRAEALEIGGLLHRSLGEVFGLQVSVRALAQALGDFRRFKFLLRDSGKHKSRLVGGAEVLLRMKRGVLAGHFITDAPLETEPPDALVTQAEDLGADLMAAARSYWAGELGPLELSRRIGNKSYWGNGEALL